MMLTFTSVSRLVNGMISYTLLSYHFHHGHKTQAEFAQSQDLFTAVIESEATPLTVVSDWRNTHQWLTYS